MKILRSPEEVIAWRNEVAQKGERVSFVPTMGALHPGHASLVEKAKKLADKTIVSIFVNPLQFNDPKDLAAYPKTLERDCDLLTPYGVDAVFAPDKAESIYQENFSTSVSVKHLAVRWEGASRPGHFDGVATVVTLLFNIVRPDVAIFGEKDFQQLSIIEQMVKDLWLPIQIVRGATVREEGGLAMSSRNARLSPQGRAIACTLNRALLTIIDSAQKGERTASKIIAAGQALIQAESGIKLDYLALVNEKTLEPVDKVEVSTRVLIAAYVEGVRLIDNMAVMKT